MIISSNRKPESKVALTVSILDYNVKNVCSVKYLGVFISADFKWNQHVEHIASKVNQRLGLLKRIKHLKSLLNRAFSFIIQFNIMPLFDYADLVWGDKHILHQWQVYRSCKIRLRKSFWIDLYIPRPPVHFRFLNGYPWSVDVLSEDAHSSINALMDSSFMIYL